MAGFAKKSLALACLLVLGSLFASAQTDELLPEIDIHLKLTSDVRLTLQAKETREAGDPVQAEIGPSVEFYLKPLIRLKKATEFDLDDAKTRPLVGSIGYRSLPSASNAPTTNRMEPVVTVHFPTRGKFLLSDRNRADLDWKAGTFTWRYRNRVEVERTLTVHSYHVSPYASTEFFYQSKYGKWSDTAIYVGCLFPIQKRLEFNPYYEHQNNTGNARNLQFNQLGLILSLYLPGRKQ